MIFTSDNGPWLSYGNHAGSAGPLREGKGHELGRRRARAVRRPLARQVIPAGSVCHEPAMTIDLLPTIAQLDRRQAARAQDRRARRLAAAVRRAAGEESARGVLLLLCRQRAAGRHRAGSMKLYLPHTYRTLGGRSPAAATACPSTTSSAKSPQPELYDVDADIGETKNVAAEHPEVVERLLALAEQARGDLGDSLTGRVRRRRARTRPTYRRVSRHVAHFSLSSSHRSLATLDSSLAPTSI